MSIMLLKIEPTSNNNEYNNTINIPIYISYYFKSLQIPFYMLFFVCYVGYEYAMCNFTPNKLCYVD